MEGDIKNEDRHGQDPRDAHQQRREAAQTLLKRGRAGALRQSCRDSTEGSRRPGGDHHAVARSLVHDRAHECARREVDARGLRLRLRRLGDGQRLTGEHRFVAFERVDVEQPQIGGHDVPDGDAHDVTGHQHDRVDQLIPAVTTNHRAVVDLLVQCLDRALGTELIDEAEQDAHHHDRRDDDRVGRIAREA